MRYIFQPLHSDSFGRINTKFYHDVKILVTFAAEILPLHSLEIGVIDQRNVLVQCYFFRSRVFIPALKHALLIFFVVFRNLFAHIPEQKFVDEHVLLYTFQLSNH
jgi:hypothetical protein